MLKGIAAIAKDKPVTQEELAKALKGASVKKPATSIAGRGIEWNEWPAGRRSRDTEIWTGFEGDYLQSEETRSPWLRYPPGTLLNEIYTAWRWPHVVDKIEHRPLGYPKIWRIAQSRSTASKSASSSRR